MSARAAASTRLSGPRFIAAILLVAAAALAYGSKFYPDFWFTAAQRGDRLMAEKRYREAAEVYDDPWHIGTAQYRNGDFKQAAATFSRVPGANGAFNRGDALFMHGAYEDAIASYKRALGFRPGWEAAEKNIALAKARKQLIDDAGEDRDQESAQAYNPDETVFDQEGDDEKSKPRDMNDISLSDESLRATWLRRVQTTPRDFLRAKFAYQAAHETEPPAGAEGEVQ
jgi:Ca-activated chloride channel family protein